MTILTPISNPDRLAKSTYTFILDGAGNLLHNLINPANIGANAQLSFVGGDNCGLDADAYGCFAWGISSFAGGYFSLAWGGGAHAVNSSQCFGGANSSEGTCSFCINDHNGATGEVSFCFGDGSRAYAFTSAAGGSIGRAVNPMQFAIGGQDSNQPSGNSNWRVGALTGQTTNATPKELTIGGAAASEANVFYNGIEEPNRFRLRRVGDATQGTYAILSHLVITIVGMDSTATDTLAMGKRAIVRVLADGTIAVLHGEAVGTDWKSAGASTWAAAVTVDGTNECILVTVTGEAGRTIYWRATVEETMIGFAPDA